MDHGIVEARDLTKIYDREPVVDGISFAVRRGECFGILGPNGAGKTTTIKMICCFSPVTSGELLVFGLPVSQKNHAAIKTRLGVVSQENNRSGDKLYLFPGGPSEKRALIESLDGERFLRRDSTLEDVFLKLTGRELRD